MVVLVEYPLLIIFNYSYHLLLLFITPLLPHPMSIRTSAPLGSPLCLSEFLLNPKQTLKSPKLSDIKQPQPSPPKPKQKSKSRSRLTLSNNKHSRSKSAILKSNEKDSSGGRLVQQLREHNDKLIKKLHLHTVLYNVEPINRCIKHDCYLSAFDTTNNKLLCAACYTQIKPTKYSTTSPTPSPSTPSKQPNAPKIIPLQKSPQLLQAHTISTKHEIESEIHIIQQIQDILYAGFEEERKQLNAKLRVIDDKYEQAIAKLKQLQIQVREDVMRKYGEERKKHQAVIKELGLLKMTVQDYLYPKQSQSKSDAILDGLRNQIYVSSIKKNRLETSISDDLRSLDQSLRKINSLSSHQSSEPSLKQSIYKHLIYQQVSQSLKFGKSGFMWSKQKHRNSIKQLTDKLIQQIQSISKSIPSPNKSPKNP